MQKSNKLLVIFLSFILLFTGCIEEDKTADTIYEEATVVKVVDGDTIKVEIDGKIHKLRMIGIDTPELDHEYANDDYYANEALNFSRNTLSDKKVYLEIDTAPTDHYDRLLRYVWLEVPDNPDDPTVEDIANKSINGMLVSGGYAYAYSYPPNTKYDNKLKKIEKSAKEKNLGIWDFDAAERYESGNEILSGPIRGNKNSMIYHLPGGEGYDKISKHNIMEFESEDEARRAGFKKARN